MKIGIIGASLSGLIAGEKLARAGHDVTVIEKNRTLGGRLATHQMEGRLFDYGLPFLTAESSSFKQFIQSLVNKDILYKWADQFPLYDGAQLHEINPNRPENKYYSSQNGLNAVANHLKRWVDVKSDVQAGGLTYIGPDRSKKRSWMINLTDISVFECDAVILATPAPQAYGILQTAQDETPARRIIRVIDEIQYQPRYALMASYDTGQPSWKGIECEGNDLRWIGNEASKKGIENAHLTIHSSAAFARQYVGKREEEITEALLNKAAGITQSWVEHPRQTSLHFWKYYRTQNPINEYFMELEMKGAPLALIGDYFMGNSAETAYTSGNHLADYWITKYDAASVNV